MRRLICNLLARYWNKYYVAAVVAPLLIIALIPALREPAQRFEMAPLIAHNILPIAYDFSDNSFEDETVSAPAIESWKLSHPIQIQFENYNSHESIYQPYWQVPSRIGPLLSLAQKNQSDAALLATAFMGETYATGALDWDGRIAGPWESDWRLKKWVVKRGSFSNAFAAISANTTGTPSPVSTTESYTDFHTPRHQIDNKSSTAELGLQLSQRGQALEPQNTYFDWMAARYLFALHRDDEAIRVLLAASKKKDFNLHRRERLQAGFDHMDSVGAKLAEDRLQMARDDPSSTNNGILLHVQSLALWVAMQKEDQGEMTKSLQIQAALMHLGRVIFDRGLYQSDKILGAKIAQRVWAAPLFMSRARRFFWGTIFLPGPVTEASPNAFMRVSNRAGRNDLSREALELANRIGDFAIRATWYDNVTLISGNVPALTPPGKTGPAISDGFHPVEPAVSSKGAIVQRIYRSWWGIQLGWLQLKFSFLVLVFFTLIGPWRAPKNENFSHFSNRVLAFVMLASGVVFVLCTTASFFFYDDVRAGSLWRTTLGSLSNNLAAEVSILSTVTSGLIGGLIYSVVTARKIKTLPIPEPEPVSRPTTLGASPEMEQWHRWFWISFNFCWFRLFPWLLFGAFVLGNLLSLILSLTLGVNGGWIAILQPSPSWGNVREWNSIFGIAGLVFMASMLVRWRFFMPKFQRATIFAGFLGFRRVLAWTLPLSLWLSLGYLINGAFARYDLDIHLTEFLATETSSQPGAQP